MRTVGTVVRGVRAPVIREGDDLAKIVVESIVNCGKEENITFQDKDVVAVTEAVVARAQGNYAPVDAIAKDVQQKFGTDTIGVTFPIRLCAAPLYRSGLCAILWRSDPGLRM